MKAKCRERASERECVRSNSRNIPCSSSSQLIVSGPLPSASVNGGWGSWPSIMVNEATGVVETIATGQSGGIRCFF